MSDSRGRRPPLSLPLGSRELEFARLYASGLTDKAIAARTHSTLENVNITLHRAKMKYRNTGNVVATRADLLRCLLADGTFHPEPTTSDDPTG